ncbi:glycosyltransferase family 25 protein [Allgaiera indica]|uniref:Glycosyltransferase involved in LPS biosynthesis, GR25 family n=1 Tax=Allgaiera indica TaxID=765699 RepID=A0A1H3DHN9_9RHOB|nr:glycosyltransferase family 25 protein [Allgaiera indica]SDX65935.1 Glycosyltransferase involved in LPS biosynthesis, GR25 family [Allgaiera indica]
MQAFLINLDRATERRAYMLGELKRLWPELVVNRALAVDIKAPDWQPPARYRPGKWRSDRWALGPSDIEIFRSHLDCWEKIARSDQPGLVLEDDLLFSEQFRTSVEKMVQHPHPGVIRLDGLSRSLLLEAPIAICQDVGISRLRSLAPSSAAYLLWPQAAQALVSTAWIARTVDDFLFDPYPADRGTRGHGLPVWQFEPAPCTQAQFGGYEGAERSIPECLRITERKDTVIRKNRRLKGPLLYRLRKEFLRIRQRRLEAARVRRIVADGGRHCPAQPAPGLSW